MRNIEEEMKELFFKYGWEIKTGKQQALGSPADIYAELIDDDDEFMMVIDDGNCTSQLIDPVYHIYHSNMEGKIFEGRIRTPKEFITVMKVLQFDILFPTKEEVLNEIIGKVRADNKDFVFYEDAILAMEKYHKLHTKK